jgi:hypothetical protein
MVCARIARQGIQSLELSCRDADNQLHGALNWRCETSNPDEVPDWVLHFSAQADGDITTYLSVRGSSSHAEALRAANDLFIFCNSLCRNQAVINCAIEEHRVRNPLDPQDYILPFRGKPGLDSFRGKSTRPNDPSQLKAA